MAKYRDRKLGKTYSFAGTDCFADTTAKGHIRNAFELGTGIVSNWDVEEHVLDWTFLKLGLNERRAGRASMEDDGIDLADIEIGGVQRLLYCGLDPLGVSLGHRFELGPRDLVLEINVLVEAFKAALSVLDGA